MQPVESPSFCAKPCKQNSAEKVGTYGADIQHVACEVHPVSDTFSQTAQDTIMHDVFISGLKGTGHTGIKGRVLEHDPNTFQQTLDFALKAEAQNWLLEATNPIISDEYNSSHNMQISSVNIEMLTLNS